MVTLWLLKLRVASNSTLGNVIAGGTKKYQYKIYIQIGNYSSRGNKVEILVLRQR
jgi:hypothetical protein